MAEKTKKPTVRIELTPEQKEQIKQVTGKEVSEVALKPEMLEERVAPSALSSN